MEKKLSFKPFKALRPMPDLVADIAALPYDVVSSQEAREIVQANPLSFLKIDRPETALEEGTHIYDGRVYEAARDNLQALIDKGYLLEEKEESYYIYRLTRLGRSQTGLVGLSSIDNYLQGKIKKHEFTRKDKEKDRLRHVATSQAQTGPIFLCAPENLRLKEILRNYTESTQALYDFQAQDSISHQVWRISDKIVLEEIENLLAQIEAFYIADGHHRTEAAVQYGLKMREENPAYTGKEIYNYFLSVVFSQDELVILDYNRLVKDLANLSKDEFFSLVSEKFVINQVDSAFRPQEKYQFGMYYLNNWYELTIKDEFIDREDPVKNLDVSILQDYLLGPILNIVDPRTDERIDFVGGSRPLEELEERVDKDMALAFTFFPTSIEELIAISDAGQVMPPKSTWFEPKLRSGIFINSLK